MFEKGVSGNPAGRPKQKPFLDWCKKWTVERAEAVLIPLAETPGKNQIRAVELIMAYGVGKPVESIEASHQFEGLAQEPAEIAGALAEIVERGSRQGLGASSEHGTVAKDATAQVPDPERRPNEGNQ